MEIERINENTVKFYNSYVDIESRGFEREEIWYNRERSEQLFWQMMDEVNYKEDFPVEGPLWIQVQALEKGLEIIVTKAQITDNHSLEALEEVEDLIDLTVPDKDKGDLDVEMNDVEIDEDELEPETNVELITSFADFEDVIKLSHYFKSAYEKEIKTSLFYYENKYYLYIDVQTSIYDIQADILSQILEYSIEEDMTVHMLAEYGKLIIANDVFAEIKQYF